MEGLCWAGKDLGCPWPPLYCLGRRFSEHHEEWSASPAPPTPPLSSRIFTPGQLHMESHREGHSVASVTGPNLALSSAQLLLRALWTQCILLARQ
jgi:hypothetical protein